MKKHLAITLLLALTVVGCGKKDADKTAAAGDKPAATEPATSPAAPRATAGTPATAADLPAECKEFTDAMEKLMSCDKLPAESRTKLHDGYQKMLNAMIKLGDKKASVDGCKSGVDSLKQALTTAGC